MFTLYDVKMIQTLTFPAAPSTERVPSLAERVAYLRHPINLRLFNWRVPALVMTHLRFFFNHLHPVAQELQTRESSPVECLKLY